MTIEKMTIQKMIEQENVKVSTCSIAAVLGFKEQIKPTVKGRRLVFLALFFESKFFGAEKTEEEDVGGWEKVARKKGG